MDPKESGNKRRYRAAEEWRALVSAWKASEKTRRLWCKEQGLSCESLRRWTKRLRSNTEENVSFVEIAHRPPLVGMESTTRVQVNPDGQVELSGAITEELLRCVLRLVREAAHVS
jgi:hypothetical protein